MIEIFYMNAFFKKVASDTMEYKSEFIAKRYQTIFQLHFPHSDAHYGTLYKYRP